MSLTVTDLFCGAGGSSTGATQVPGVTIRVASNHWDLAVETHNINHPNADHICADLSQINPAYFPATDCLWGSPECTNHSRAKGVKQAPRQADLFDPETLPDAAAERSRATMWDIPRFAEYHQYAAVIVENVVEAANWAPFRAWLSAMESLGYTWQIVCHNSAHAGHLGPAAPQSRDRLYVIFTRNGVPRPDLEPLQRPTAWCPTCAADVHAVKAWKRRGNMVGRYRAQYVYRCPNAACRNQVIEPGWVPASSVIDWSDLGGRIGDRKRPLAPKTMARIEAGRSAYWGQALAVPVEGWDGKVASPVSLPLRTLTTRVETAIATPPFIAELRGGGSWARPASEPLATITASGNHHGLATRGSSIAVDDMHFRMLRPDELKRGMAFPTDYKILGSRREQGRMIGNAVTPPAARDLFGAVARALGVTG